MNFTSNFFVQNRQHLYRKMKKDSVLILLSNDQYPKNGDQQFPFRQQSDLFYFTGITQEETSLIISKNKDEKIKETLFILKPNLKLETWEGKKLTKQEASIISGIKSIQWNSIFDKQLKNDLTNETLIYLLGQDAFNQPTNLNLKHTAFEKEIKKQFNRNKIKSPRKIINDLRIIKSNEEIIMMQKAVDITNLAFEQVLKNIKPSQKEYEIEAEISYIFRKKGAEGHAYAPIIAEGINACSLHYIKNNTELKAGNLVLMDVGANYSYYAADLSRTIPINGKFTNRQKELYQLVLEIQKKAIGLFTPGNTINIINKNVNTWMKEALTQIGLLKPNENLHKYYPHGTSHFLGIDVHDVGNNDIPFEKGMVLTCEPGLYIKEEGIGIRIENDILVDDTPIDLMQKTIREIEDIEKIMNHT